MTATKGHGLVRVLFELEPNAWHGSATERLWAAPVGSGRFRLRNTPFFAFGVSAEDVVFADEKDGQLVFRGVSLRGGHSTYRLIVTDETRFAEHWSPLQAVGCSYEQGQVLAVDVPPGADIYLVYSLLEAGEKGEAWEFQEGHCGHPLRDDP